MSDAQGGGLQFERAESAASPVHCGACQQALVGSYFTAGSQILCERCKTELGLLLQRRAGLAGVLLAILWGSLAGVLGAGVWWGVRAGTGYEVGLIAIAVGYFVGMGVRRGSAGRGGRGYQVLAVALTYFWIAANYAPDVVREFIAGRDAASAEVAAEGAGEGTASAPQVPTPDAPTNAAGESHPALALLVFAAFVMAVALAAPFLSGVDNLIGLLIIAFGLYQAWKMNAPMRAEIAGPFAVAAASTPSRVG